MNHIIEKILNDFEGLNAIPRCSGNEAGPAACAMDSKYADTSPVSTVDADTRFKQIC